MSGDRLVTCDRIHARRFEWRDVIGLVGWLLVIWIHARRFECRDVIGQTGLFPVIGYTSVGLNAVISLAKPIDVLAARGSSTELHQNMCSCSGA